MKLLARFFYNTSRLVLFLLALAFLSFYLVTMPGLTETVTPIVEYSTQFLPILLVPVTIAMAIVLLLRYATKRRNESINFGDILAGILAMGGQLGVIALYRAQGSEVLHSNFLTNIPDVTALAEKAVPLGILGVVGLQLITLFFYWKADPNPRPKEA